MFLKYVIQKKIDTFQKVLLEIERKYEIQETFDLF